MYLSVSLLRPSGRPLSGTAPERVDAVHTSWSVVVVVVVLVVVVVVVVVVMQPSPFPARLPARPALPPPRTPCPGCLCTICRSFVAAVVTSPSQTTNRHKLRLATGSSHAQARAAYKKFMQAERISWTKKWQSGR